MAIKRDEPVQAAPAASNNKHPELTSLRDKLLIERAAMVKRATPLREKRDRLLEQIAPALAEIRALEKEFRAIEQPRLAEIDNQIGGIAKAMGGRSLSSPQPQQESDVNVSPAQ